jgi:4-cresol dehydrogenase (hydroxylating) flavoprotein subunit
MDRSSALKKLGSILGSHQILSEGEEFEMQCHSTLPDSHPPIAFVFPESTKDIVNIVHLARTHNIKLWTVSRGFNWGYGSQSPIEAGMLVVKLQRMNRIIEINEELAYAIIEPGVTFRQLRDELENNYPHLWSDCTDGPPDGSVIGNALDRGLGVTPYGDRFGNLCGMEVILANGKVIRTGGGGQACATWPTHKWGVGPYIEGLFTQGNFGIVTQASVWLWPKPEYFESFTCDVKNTDDIGPLVDTMRELLLSGVVRSFPHIVNDIVLLAILAQYPKELAGTTSSLNNQQLHQLKEMLKLPEWSLGGSISGTDTQVREAKHILRKRLRPFGKIVFLNDKTIGRINGILAFREKFKPQSRTRKAIEGFLQTITKRPMKTIEASAHIHSVLKGKPSDFFVRHAYFKSKKRKPEHSHPDRDNVGLIWFAPVVPMTGKHVTHIIDICKPLHKKHGFDFYLALLVQNPRSIICLQCIFFNKQNPEEVERAKTLFQKLVSTITSEHYQQYRVGTLGMKDLFKNDPDYHEFLQSIKNSVDPNNIFSPGKYDL